MYNVDPNRLIQMIRQGQNPQQLNAFHFGRTGW